jgi:DNA-directed RNA polymerase specialized sigma24 family protein
MVGRGGGMDDGQLMARFYEGDPAAFDVLTERWWSRLFGYFRRRGFTEETAEDLALEALVQLFLTRERMSFDVERPLGPFLFRAAYHLAIREWRAAASRPSLLPLQEIDVPQHSSLPSAMLEELTCCIYALPEPELTYVLLCGRHGIGDLEHQEIAATLERSPARVSQISRSALDRLRACLEAKEA